MPGLSLLVVAYGLLSIALGFVGYQSGSAVSLYAGGGAGLVAIVAGLISKSNSKLGHAIAALVCVALLGNFVPKLLKEFNWIPGGTMAIASGVVLVALIYGHFAAKKP